MAVAPRSSFQPEHFMGRNLPRQRKTRHPMKATTTCNPSPPTATWPSIQPAPKATGHVPFTRHTIKEDFLITAFQILLSISKWVLSLLNTRQQKPYHSDSS